MQTQPSWRRCAQLETSLNLDLCGSTTDTPRRFTQAETGESFHLPHKSSTKSSDGALDSGIKVGARGKKKTDHHDAWEMLRGRDTAQDAGRSSTPTKTKPLNTSENTDIRHLLSYATREDVIHTIMERFIHRVGVHCCFQLQGYRKGPRFFKKRVFLEKDFFINQLYICGAFRNYKCKPAQRPWNGRS